MSPAPDDLKALWRDQPSAPPDMNAQAIRALARSYGSNARERLFTLAILVAVEACVFTLMAWRAPNTTARLGDLLVVVGLGFLVWRSYAQRPGRLPEPGASVQTLVAFHRAQLQRRQTGFGWMMVSVAPMFLGLMVILYGFHLARPHADPRNFAPFAVLTALWLVAAWIVQRRQAKRLRDEIAELDAMSGR